MKVNDPLLVTNLVRADSSEASKGFCYIDPDDGKMGYFLPLGENPHFNLNFTDPARKGSELDYVPVLNVREDCLGVVLADKIVEPVNFIVNVEGKE
ncbi:hypothetical protein LCGC14_2256440 [marine sediment metagenome]|uniref:Uncharacterized protein n=1 Tax=marine sediment metagenome TaxID=412755 RepID=A0A0F9D1F1_9ZZZZ